MFLLRRFFYWHLYYGFWLLLLQGSPTILLPFNRLKQCLKVALSETLGTMAFNDLEEQCRPVFYRLGEKFGSK